MQWRNYSSVDPGLVHVPLLAKLDDDEVTAEEWRTTGTRSCGAERGGGSNIPEERSARVADGHAVPLDALSFASRLMTS